MSRFSVVLLSLAACGFDVQTSSPASDAASVDGRDAPGDSSQDAPCFMVGESEVCDPVGPLTLSGMIDTTSDPRCTALVQSNGPEACLVSATQVTIGDLVAIGARPLVIASTSTLVVTGTLDLSSQRGVREGAGANHSTCAVQRQAQSDRGGAAGGAGGSFQGKGGDGGEGDTDDSLGEDGTAQPGLASNGIAAPASVRGGCRGGAGGNEGNGGTGGMGGSSGGSVWLVAANTITIAGAIRATGAGGSPGQVQSGGGGGGSGGMIILEATTVTIDGQISANGGGGGEGGTRIDSTAITGNPGADGNLGTTRASGGSGAQGSSGDGGDGAAGSNGDGEEGQDTIVGAGGGGGAAGFVEVRGARTGNGVVSPS